MQFNPSPKSEFHQVKQNVEEHRVLVQNPILRRNLNIAIAEMSRRITLGAPADNMGACAAGHLRMLGAQDLVEVFMNLGEVAVATPKIDNDNLPANVRTLKQS